MLEGSTIHSDGWNAYDGLILNGYDHYRVFHSENEFARGKYHVNGIENVQTLFAWSFAKFNGCDSDKFVIHLMECEWRYNHRNKDLYKKEKMKKLKAFSTILIFAFGFFVVGCESTKNYGYKGKHPDYLVLVNKTHPISVDYAKSLDLVTVDTVYDDETAEIEKATYGAYLSLKSALEKQGIEIGIDSAYRSVEYQEQIMLDFTEKYGEEYARNTVAVPGTSEHHTGLAIDIVPKVNGEWKWENEDMMQLPELFSRIHKELPNHGFILRFLKGKEKITGYSYEPWHIRYVGSVEVAQEITDSGLVLEEYLEEFK